MTLPRRILVATDFSESSRNALVFGARLAVQCGAELHLVHAEDPLLAAAAAHGGLDLGPETRQELQRMTASAWPAGELPAHHHVVNGDAADAVLTCARREGADIVVAGARGLSRTGRLVFGSTAERLLRKARLPVLIVPAAWTAPRPEARDLAGVGPIVVGVDFLDPSRAAARMACTLAAALQTSVDVVHVVPPLPVLERWQLHADAAVATRIDLARRDLASMTAALEATVPVQTRVEEGDVAECLAETASSVGGRHPLLVLGRLGNGTPGTIAYRTLTLATVPLLMYAPPA